MINKLLGRFKFPPPVAEHVSENELLSYLDGELQPEQDQRIRTHLATCWSCRVLSQEIETAIAAFVDFRDAQVKSEACQPPGEWQGFEDKLRRAAAETDETVGVSRFLSALTQSWLPTTLKVACCIFVILLLIFSFNSVPSVSAKEVLQRAEQARAKEIEEVHDPVIYQRIQLRRTGEPGGRSLQATIEVWSDYRHGRVRHRGEEELWAEIQTVLMGTLRAENLLSPSGHMAWRESIRIAKEEAFPAKLPDGSRAVVVKTISRGPYRANEITEASLVIRARDWHPVELNVRIEGENGVFGYELTEAAFEVMPLEALESGVFADSKDSTEVTKSSISSSVKPSGISNLALTHVGSRDSMVDARDLDSVEIEVRYSIHRISACLGDPIEIFQEPTGHVVIRGITDTSARARQIREALSELSSLSLIRAEIKTIGERTGDGGPAFEAGSYESPLGRELYVARLPIQDQLQQYFLENHGGVLGGRRRSEGMALEIMHLVNEAISTSGSALAEAWALRRLTERYGNGGIGRLRPSSQWLLEIMVRDHLNALRAKATQNRELIEPVLASFVDVERQQRVVVEPSENEQVRTAADWVHTCGSVFRETERLNNLVLGLFAGAGVEGRSPVKAAAEVLALFPRLEGATREFEAEIAGAFSGERSMVPMGQQGNRQ